MRRSKVIAGFIVALVLLQFACTSRYRLDLNLIEGGESYSASVESSQYILDAALADPLAANKWVSGDGSVAVLGLSVNGRPFMPKEQKFVLDNQLRCRLYLELPPNLGAEPFNLVASSFLQVLGQYDWPTEETIFDATSGTARVDSLVSSQLYVTLTDAQFANSGGRTLDLNGQLKFKIKE